ncbi:ECF transporter S component [Eggerthia catenaformis]|uniref:ECF transporter S component n=1 Tax=Eggerthia catenaformis TaxID=31973 RepID=UPI00047DDA75|nr:ECF transporter S component [Eggerthia catenaformis]
MENKKINTKTLVIVSMLGAIAALLMFIEISLPFAPTFVKFDISDLPVLISGFLFGPFLGVLTAVIKIIIKLLIKPTSTFFIGEFSNFILSVVFMGTASFIYRKHRTKKYAVIGVALATLWTSVVAIISNWLLIFPLYAKMFGMTMESIVKMASAINPLVKNTATMFFFSLFPFNLFKYGMISFITFLIYKKISVVIKRYIK